MRRVKKQYVEEGAKGRDRSISSGAIAPNSFSTDCSVGVGSSSAILPWGLGRGRGRGFISSAGKDNSAFNNGGPWSINPVALLLRTTFPRTTLLALVAAQQYFRGGEAVVAEEVLSAMLARTIRPPTTAIFQVLKATLPNVGQFELLMQKSLAWI
ncbi:unnamed protein product [Gongylonema pulchrum]|uniref:Pentatricopeptide repeat-containing protein n=1 Tax=Gongylonema pulchrum TaxID=637853 RepID=A0A183EWS3_9BILA|nr:unnamed protein product [Gongylonema pulchrum]